MVLWRIALEERAMATGRLLKKVFAMSALAGALLIAAPGEAHDRDHDGDHGWGGRGWHHEEYRGHGWGDRDDHWRDRGYYHHWDNRGWGYYPRYYGPPRYYHRHYRGCGHAGYDHGFYDGALLGFLVDYARDE
jgi:hypothetical protein